MSESDFVPTRASLLKAKSHEAYQEVQYVSYKSKKKEKPEDAKNRIETNAEDKNEFNIYKAKREVMQFGISGFDTAKKEEAKIQQLIKLGAKPPKKKNKNYKELLKEKKMEKEKKESTQQFQQLGKNSMGKSVAKGKSYDRKRRREGILDIYGRIIKDKDRAKMFTARKNK
ncbi:uncharacterized protein C1orf131 [Anthonomus grandis grandis]|uniref:uncharacterized protein C1orf131 n=1 Tax=Anthonomus grandis grandis TaxID=2921223 RepID=UPI0021668495|nr:uncharacterized protein C1orf131 [Anthonomus grandis grandis]